MKRIGIFQYQWPLQIHTINLATQLARNGFQVDLFLYECDTSFVDPMVLATHPNVRLFAYNRSLTTKMTDKIVRVVRRIAGLPCRHPQRKTQVIKRTLKNMETFTYDYFIGIEKEGLIWAGMLAEKLNVPFLYYSLELYIEDHPALAADGNFAAIRPDEKKFHARAAGTIVQDELRAKALFDGNEVEIKNAIYIPVSVSGSRVEHPGHFLHEKLGIDYSKKIILYIGQVCKNRGVNELIESAKRLDEEFVMVFHGPLSLDVATNNDCVGKVFFSQDMIGDEEIPKLVSSAYIGIALYGMTNTNDRLTAFSSEKIAYYMQSGLPIIARRNESYELLMSQHYCGEMIEHIHQLPEAVQRIKADYIRYRRNAFEAYEHFYSFDTNVRSLIGYLSHHLKEC